MLKSIPLHIMVVTGLNQHIHYLGATYFVSEGFRLGEGSGSMRNWVDWGWLAELGDRAELGGGLS